MEHPTIVEAIEDIISNREEKWDQFFQGEWFINRIESGFEESAFVYEGKIWYNQEKQGSGSYYSEGNVSEVLSLFLNPGTKFIHSNLKEKMNEVMEKKKEGFLISNTMSTFDFQTRTRAIHRSKFPFPGEQNSEMDMFDLGEHLAWLIMEPTEWKYVKV